MRITCGTAAYLDLRFTAPNDPPPSSNMFLVCVPPLFFCGSLAFDPHRLPAATTKRLRCCCPLLDRHNKQERWISTEAERSLWP